MNRFALTDDLLTGVDSIDEQHRNLLELASRVTSDRFAHFSRDRLNQALTACADYVQYHFAAEEHLMQSVGDPNFEAHRSQHDDFRLEISELVDAARQLGVTIAVRERLNRLIETAFFDHIQQFDLPLAAHARASVAPREPQLPDSATLVKAGVLLEEVQEQYASTNMTLDVG